MIRTVIVDDEPLAREGLRLRLAGQADIDVVGEAADGDEAVALIGRERPDLMFLDVQMPGMDGFEVLDRIAAVHLPWVVFVTAFDAHAVRAFEVRALDYLLKPPSEDRIAEALSRVRRERSRESPDDTAGDRVASLLDDTGATASGGRWVVRERGRIRLIAGNEIRWVRSAGNYVELHTAGGDHLVRVPLVQAAARLGHAFVQLHRSVLVRRSLVREIVRTGNGDFKVVLDDGAELPFSRRFRLDAKF